ncbi:MAG: hypothetical protein ACLFR0_02340 [Alphaproteobacteria bacterium]
MSFSNNLTKGVFAGSLLASTSLAEVPDPLGEYITAHQNDHTALAGLICEQAQEHKYIFLGDTNHGSDLIREAVNSPEVLSAIERCTLSDVIVLEGPPSEARREQLDIDSYNRSIESYKRSLQSLEDFENLLADDNLSQEHRELIETLLEDTHSSFERREYLIRQQFYLYGADVLVRGHFGVQSRYYDQGYDFTPEERQTISTLWRSYDADIDCAGLRVIFQARHDHEDPGQALLEIDRLLADRVEIDNDAIAQGIVENHTRGAVIFYGAGHMDYEYDLNEMVGAENSVVINIIDGSEAGTIDYDQSYLRHLFPRVGQQLFGDQALETQEPDFTYDAFSQSYVAGDPDSAENLDLAPISEEKFNQCIAAFPSDVRNAFIDRSGLDFTHEDIVQMTKKGAGLPDIIQNWGLAPVEFEAH